MHRTLLVLVLYVLTASFAPNPRDTPTTFSYTKEEIQALADCPIPESTVTNDQLARMGNEVDFLVETANLPSIESTIFPAYLANAQKDFAWISYRLTGKFAGSLGPVTLWTVRLFIPGASLPSVKAEDFDPFSSGIAALVISKAAKRLKEEREQIADYPIRTGPEKWAPVNGSYVGLNYGTVKTWYLDSAKEFVIDTPPEDMNFWKKECQEVLKIMAVRDGRQTERVFWWAHLPERNAGDWSAILQKYFEENNTPLAARLWGRALFESAFLDSNAAAFNAKYVYWIKRPSQIDPEIKPLVSVPSHPSYPSAHSTISGAVAVVLSELFPDNKDEWNATAEEAGLSRIWGGIHYPADHTKGAALGEKVGHAVIDRSSNKKG